MLPTNVAAKLTSRLRQGSVVQDAINMEAAAAMESGMTSPFTKKLFFILFANCGSGSRIPTW
jgi:hypothetical protein